MSESNAGAPKRPGFWCSLTRRNVIVAALIAIAGVLTAIALLYRDHLIWRYNENRMHLGSVPAISSGPMPDSPVPRDWVACRVGSVEVRLPPELAEDLTSAKEGSPIAKGESGHRAVIIEPAADVAEFSGFLDMAGQVSPNSRQLTLPQLRLACYQVKSSDFRWSMSRAQVRWHAFCITSSGLLRIRSGGHVETLFRDEIHGILHCDGGGAWYDWQCTEGTYRGGMYFSEKGKDLDPGWIRAICRSLTLLPKEKN